MELLGYDSGLRRIWDRAISARADSASKLAADAGSSGSWRPGPFPCTLGDQLCRFFAESHTVHVVAGGHDVASSRWRVAFSRWGSVVDARLDGRLLSCGRGPGNARRLLHSLWLVAVCLEVARDFTAACGIHMAGYSRRCRAGPPRPQGSRHGRHGNRSNHGLLRIHVRVGSV